jgi:hypothetical protein
VLAALTAKGFVRIDSKDIRLIYHRVDGKKSARSTMISHGEREIGDRLLGRMARQVGLPMRDFLRLVDCPMSQADYEAAVFVEDQADPAEG